MTTLSDIKQRYKYNRNSYGGRLTTDEIWSPSKRRSPVVEVVIWPYLHEGLDIPPNRTMNTQPIGPQVIPESTDFFTYARTQFIKSNNILPRKFSITNHLPDELGLSLTSLSYGTSLSNNGIGNFSIEVTAKKIINLSNTGQISSATLFEQLALGSLLHIFIDQVFICSGTINDISYSAQNKPSQRIVISGSNLGHLLNLSMFYDESDGRVLDNGSLLRGVSESADETISRAGGDIRTLTVKILDLWLKDVLQTANYNFADSSGSKVNILKWFDYDPVESASVPPLNYEVNLGDYPLFPSLWNYEGPLLDYIKQVISHPFNELYVVQGNDPHFDGLNSKRVTLGNQVQNQLELEDTKMYLILRKTPFDDFRYMQNTRNLQKYPGTEFKNLLTFVLHEKNDIENMNITRSSNECYSRFAFTHLEILTSTKIVDKLAPPEYLGLHLQRFGYKPLNLSLARGEAADGELDDILSSIASFQERAAQWHSISDLYSSGSITHIGFPEIQIGERLKIITDNLSTKYEFYIEGYKHKWDLISGFSTTTTVQRGLSSFHLNLMEGDL